MMSPYLLVPSLIVFLLAITVQSTAGCNEAVCASLVSKCLLLKSCECNMSDRRNCSCCTDCHRCLARLYTDCCSCVGMCPEKKAGSSLHRASSVEELTDPIPELFDVLTAELDPHSRWTTYTYPAHLDLLYFNPKNTPLDPELSVPEGGVGEGREVRRHGDHLIVVDTATTAPNCTVAYMSTCLSLGRCRDSCASMGAARYRWFHSDGCCECIGVTCLDYGKGEPLCLRCPVPDDQEEDVDDADYYDVHEAEKYTDSGAMVDDTEQPATTEDTLD